MIDQHFCLLVWIMMSLMGDTAGQLVENPIVKVTEGKLKGALITLVNGEQIYGFKGIPYAQPPVGNLRFTAPRPPIPWQGIRDATQHGPVCPQYNELVQKLIPGSEDCLFLNVYSKNLCPNAKTPVMVFIHGGSNRYGSGNYELYSPEFLLQHNAVLVTMNYRLETLGYLGLDTAEVPGNAGMKDQVAALRWTKKNIAKFGGDPDRITLFGESSGAGAVTYHLLSPMSRGLIQGAIAESGVCTVDWELQENPKERAFRIAKYLGKDPKNTDELLQFLREVKPLDLVNVTYVTMTKDEKLRDISDVIVPVVEKKFPNIEAFITEKAIDLISKGKVVNKVPLIVGYNSAEGIFDLTEQIEKLDFYNKNPSYWVPRMLAEKLSQEKLIEFGARIKKFYVGNRDITKDDVEAIVNMQTDINFAYQSHRFTNLYATLNVPVYMYRFNYDTVLNVIKALLGYSNLPGACHGDEIFYLFLQEYNRKAYTKQKKLRDIVFNITKIWTDFASHGHPTPNPKGGLEWTPYTKECKEYLRLEEGACMGQYADRERMEFWNQLFIEAGLPHIS